MTQHNLTGCHSCILLLAGCIETHLDVTGNVDLAVIRELEGIHCREEKEVGPGLGQTLGGLPPVTNQLGFSARDFINNQQSTNTNTNTNGKPLLTADSRPYQ